MRSSWMTGSNLRNSGCFNTRCQRTLDDGGLCGEAGHEVSKLNYAEYLKNEQTKSRNQFPERPKGGGGERRQWHDLTRFLLGSDLLKQH